MYYSMLVCYSTPMEQVSPLSPFPTEEQPLPRRSRKSKKWVVFLVLIIFLVSLVLGAMRYFGGKSGSEKAAQITPVPTEEIFPTDTPYPSPTATGPTPTTGPTPKPTGNPIDKTTGLDRSAFSVEVQNGSGEVGAGSRAADVLKEFGYHVISIGNADSFDYDGTTINVRDSKKAFLPLLKKDVSSAYTVSSTSATFSASSSADAIVIIGK